MTTNTNTDRISSTNLGDCFVVANVAKETAGGALSAGGGAVAGTVAATATTAALTAFGAATAPAWVPIAAGFGAAVAVGAGIKSVWDAIWE